MAGSCGGTGHGTVKLCIGGHKCIEFSPDDAIWWGKSLIQKAKEEKKGE